MTSVWPALWPPWKRTTMSARSESQSTILPLPSSPHCEPITTTFAIRRYAPRPIDRHAKSARHHGAGFAPDSWRRLAVQRHAVAGLRPRSCRPVAEQRPLASVAGKSGGPFEFDGRLGIASEAGEHVAADPRQQVVAAKRRF